MVGLVFLISTFFIDKIYQVNKLSVDKISSFANLALVVEFVSCMQRGGGVSFHNRN